MKILDNSIHVYYNFAAILDNLKVISAAFKVPENFSSVYDIKVIGAIAFGYLKNIT